jgi:hypothetical protein
LLRGNSQPPGALPNQYHQIMDVWNLVAERKIREAMDEGAFDHLEGAGRPLDLDENPFEDPSLRMAHRLLKNNGFAPAWILEGKDIDREIACIQEERHRLRRSEVDRRIAAVNLRIASYNLKVPLLTLQKSLLTLHPNG